MLSWESLGLFAAFAVGCVAAALWRSGRIRSETAIRVLVLVVLLALPIGWLAATTTSSTPTTSRQKQAEFTKAQFIPRQAEYDNHVTSDACRSCHPQHYDSWHASYHRTMTQVVSPETVVAPFDGKPMQFGNKRYRFFREGDSYFMEFAITPEDGRIREYPPMQIVMSTGSHHYQVYWVADPRGKKTEPLEVTLYWSIDHQRWIPKNDTVMIPPGKEEDSGHWNTHCIRCHSVTGMPLLNPATGEFSSQVAEFGISCEACHGAGKEHVEFHQNPLNRYREYWSGEEESSIVNPARCTTEVSSQICGRCHGNFSHDQRSFTQSGFRYRPGDDLMSEVRFFDLNNHPPGAKTKEYMEWLHWPDNTCRTGGDEFNAHQLSPCYQRGDMTCLSCHSMHDSDPNDQLAKGMEGNQACLQCHQEYTDRIEEHTHHAANSAGSLCYNCHMPHTTWALSTAMRSHRVDSPQIKPTSTDGRPNACNLCHLDQSLKWSAEKMADWYGTSVADFSDDEENLAAGILWMLKGNSMQRAIAGWHAGWAPAQEASGTDWQAPSIAQLLTDPYSQVRFVGGQSLKSLPDFSDLEYDFIGDERQRKAVSKSVLDRWLDQKRGPSTGRAKLLARPDGGLDRELIERLMKERDNTDIRIPE